MNDEQSGLIQKKKKGIPYAFVLDLLSTSEVTTRPMFGCTSVYLGEKIVFILREKASEVRDNGVWIATTKDHHKSLKKTFPEIRSIELFGTEVTAWQNLPADSESFESDVERACELALGGDPRIGKIPDRKAKKAKASPQKKKPALKPLSKKRVVRWAELQGPG